MSATGSGGRAGPPPPAAAADRGTLPEEQVRAMFDRGARGYDLLNSGMAAELTRVVRPGGRVVILEMTTPSKPPLSTFFKLWFDRVVPLLGKLSSDPDAYDYLPNSVKRWPDAAGLAAAFDRAGLEQIRWVL